MLKQGKYRVTTIILLLLLLAIVTACSEKIISSEDQGIDLQIQSSVGAWMEVTQATTFILTVTGTGITPPLTTELVYHNGFLVGNINVPAGPERLFVIQAFDEEGLLIYSGRTIADVVGGEELELDIEMVPDVPMIKLSPVYVETIQGDYLAITIKVFNLPDIGRIGIELSNLREIGTSYIRHETLNIYPELLKIAQPEIWYGDGGELNIELASRDAELYGLLDQDGYAEIATVYYKTYDYEVSPFETITFYASVDLMEDRTGTPFPRNVIEGIHAENSVAILHSFRSRRVAAYDLGLSPDTESPVPVADGSGNGLDGIATGTTIITGRFGNARLFDGNSDYITIPDHDLLDLQDGITLRMWIEIDPWSTEPPMNSRMSLVCKRDPEGAINYELLIRDISQSDEFVELEFRYGSSTTHAYRAVLSHSLFDGWVQVIFSYRFGDPESAVMAAGYGQPATLAGGWVSGDGLELPPVTAGDLLIGRDNAEIPSYFEGNMDELDIIDHGMSLELIKHYYTYYF